MKKKEIKHAAFLYRLKTHDELQRQRDAPITQYIPDVFDVIEWFLTQKTIKDFTETRKNTTNSELREIIKNSQIK